MSSIGQNRYTATTSPAVQGKSFSLGDREEDDLGNEWIYVQANGAVTGAGYVCILDAAFQAAMVSTSNDLQGALLAVPAVAFADDDYGWMQVYGACSVLVGASCAANVALNTTATAGQLDDDGTAGALLANRLVLTTARAASDGVAPATLNWPSVGAATDAPVTASSLTVTGTTYERGTVLKAQAAPAAKTVTAGLTAAEIIAGLITTTGATAPSIHQLPTGSAIDSALGALVANNDSFDFSIINTGTGASDDATITVNTDVTIVGNPTIGALTDATVISGSGTFRCRRSGTHVYVVYRLA